MEEQTLQKHAYTILQASLEAVRPQQSVIEAMGLQQNILSIGSQTVDLSAFKKICVIGAGKAGGAMAAGLESLLGKQIHSGLVIVKDGHVCPTQIVELREANHPVPDKRSISASNELLAYIKKHRSETTLFFFLLSGGASSLLVSPVPGISLEDKQQTSKLLLESGADIYEINTIRKHLSQVKGGMLTNYFKNAKLISLIISDVIGDDLTTIGSGPTTGDPTTWYHCDQILKKYNLEQKIPESVLQRIHNGQNGLIEDTPFPESSCFIPVSNYIISTNRHALEAAMRCAEKLGYRSSLLGTKVQGEARTVATIQTTLVKKIISGKNSEQPPCCLISGGETTVSLGEKYGLGGRNQEFALQAAILLEGLDNILLLSAGTDGTDGPTNAAGAYVTGQSVQKAQKLGLNPEMYLHNHDSYNFFRQLDSLVITGPTLTNVMDICIILIAA